MRPAGTPKRNATSVPAATAVTEPAAPNYDRDADNRAWEDRIADAAIAGAQEARQQGEPGREGEKDPPTAQGRYADLAPPEPANKTGTSARPDGGRYPHGLANQPQRERTRRGSGRRAASALPKFQPRKHGRASAAPPLPRKSEILRSS